MTNPVIDSYGTKRYYKRIWWRLWTKALHREDGPAIEFRAGAERWHKRSLPVSRDGDVGSKYWYRNGKLHREDGPAIEWYDGSKEWFMGGKIVDAYRPKLGVLTQRAVKRP